MRSLNILKFLHQDIPTSKSNHVCLTTDSVKGFTFVAMYDDARDETSIFSGNSIDLSLKLLTTLQIQPETDVSGIEKAGKPVALQYLAESSSLCVALASGDIFVATISNNEAEVECVGTIDAGIRCMRWSPDRELLIFVTGTDTILEMTKDFDVLSESPLHPTEFGEEEMVNVGWGKKETQFHGSEGKAAAQRKQGSVELSPDDDGQVRVSWRGDGNFFVTSSVFENKRVLRVYNREAVLQSTSEPVNQLEHGLSWRPSGNLIAASQRLPHRHDIAFFERNGLRHGEFTLREPSTTRVKELHWNLDSTVLMVWLDRLNKSVVQLWTMTNYHYYLKQELELDDVACVQWDEKNAMILHLIQANRHVLMELCWDTLRNESMSFQNPATVAVVDGCNILLTPFKFANTPPPMSTLQVSLPKPSRHVTFLPWKDHGDDFAVLMSDNTIALCDSHSTNRPLGEPMVKLVQGPQDGPFLTQLTPWTSNSFLALNFNSRQHLVLVDVSQNTWSIQQSVPLAAPALKLINVDESFAIVELEDGTLFTISEGLQVEDGWQGLDMLPTPCPWLYPVIINDEAIVLAIDNRGTFYIEGRVYSSEVTSVFCHSDALILTTNSHSVRLIPWPSNLDNFPSLDSAHTIEGNRRMERGSKIVTAVQGDQALVLQAPRGNLETVYPRLLVLSHLRHLLDEVRFLDALILCRKHRIDLNILFDHNPAMFMENVETFIRQVNDVDHLNLFLTSLKSEDVIMTLYQGKGKKGSHVSTKVNDICEIVRENLENIDSARFTQCIVTTFVKQEPPRLEEALNKIRSIKQTKGTESAEEAMKYVIFLVDVDRLYNVALGMYDFPLVLMVAQHSHKDPREYLPFLSELQSLSKPLQRHKIDDHLEKFESALRHLSETRDVASCIEYANKHNLWRNALEIFSNTQDYNQVLAAYARHLINRNKWEEAGIAYNLCGMYQDAKESFEKGLYWRDAMAMAKRLNQTEEEKMELAREMAEELIEDRQYIDAAILLRDYGHDLEKSVEAFVRGGDWQEALRTAQMNPDDSLIPVVENGVQAAAVRMLEDFVTLEETLNRRVSRLHIVREEKANRPELGLPIDDNLDNIDVMSDTTSMKSRVSTVNSVLSGASGKSSRSRRKQELKRLAGKEGSIYEEEFLIKSHTKAVEQASALQDSVGKLIKCLTRFGDFSMAKKLENALGTYLNGLTDKKTMNFIYMVAEVVVPSIEESNNTNTQVPVAPTLAIRDWRMNF